MTGRIRHRSGSTYVLVLVTATLLMAVGLAGLAGLRVRARATQAEQDWHRAGVLAQSAVEAAVAEITFDPWWRDVNAEHEDSFCAEIELAGGSFAWRLDDLMDNDLKDNAADPLRVYGLGRMGGSARVYSVAAYPIGQTLDVLRAPLHSDGDLTVEGVLDVRAGPVSTNGWLAVNNAQVLGDAEAAFVDVPGNVNGSVLAPAPPKLMPARAVWAVYSDLATEIKYNDLLGTLQNALVSPTRHPLGGAVNPDGLYRIKVSSFGTLTIRRCRIEGTLLVELDESSSLRIQDGVVWKPYRSDFPALIVYTRRDSGTDVLIESQGELSELDSGVNFNPPDTPHYGSSDTDTADVYAASMRGLVHVIRDVSLPPASITTVDAVNKITGCLVVEGELRTRDGTKVAADPALYSRPPLGYTTAPDRNTLLVNGGVEDGLTGWTTGGGALSWENSGSHSGAAHLRVKDRTAAWQGPAQDVTAKVQSGVVLDTEVWLKMNSNPEDVRVVLRVESSGEGTQDFAATFPVTKNWTRVSTQHAPTWTGTLTSATWLVETTTSTQDFRLDDAVLSPPPDGEPQPLVEIVPGTWRTEQVP